MYFLVFDIETTGTPFRSGDREIYSHIRMVQIAWQVYDDKGVHVEENDFIIKPEGYYIPKEVARIHGITTEIAMEKGLPVLEVLPVFFDTVKNLNPVFVGHNIDFDRNVLQSELRRLKYPDKIEFKNYICTMKSSTNYCRIPSRKQGYYKWPTLEELYKKLFSKEMMNAHHAGDDVRATAECLFRLIDLNVIKPVDLSNLD